MPGYATLNLQSYDISPITGFLPETTPLSRLQDPYYDPWEEIASDIPHLLSEGKLRDMVECLPVLSTSRLKSDSEWRRAYVVVSFLAQSYIWGGKEPKTNLPPQLSTPLLSISSYFQINPCATYSAFCLWNMPLKSGLTCGLANLHPDDLSSITTFTGTKDEKWFYLISAAIESRGGKSIPLMFNAIHAVNSNDENMVRVLLNAFRTCLVDISEILERMYEHCSPAVFYHQLRPFLSGSPDMTAAGLPNGIFYQEDEYGTGEWRAFKGGSNAQSSLLQLFDIFLGIEHSATGGCGSKGSRVSYIKDMRKYMPGAHREFLELMTDISNIRDYAMSPEAGLELKAAYNKAVLQLGSLRDKHLAMVSRYIIIPAAKKCHTHRADTDKGVITGTGGTDIMQFLRETRNTTKQGALSS